MPSALPAADAGTLTRAEPEARPSILLVEDSTFMHDLMAEALEPEFHIVPALDGVEGLARAVENPPDLIITDLIMPRMGGQQMITALRAHDDLRDIPIVVVTSLDSPEELVHLLESGVSDIIRKPFLLPEVAARVRNLVAAKRVHRALSQMVGRKDADLARLADEAADIHRRLKRAMEEARVARELAENASRVKSNFLRMVSHELKTPITALQLHLSVLEQRNLPGSSRDVQAAFSALGRSSRKMVDLVDTLLEWARVESGRCRLCVETFALREVADEVAESLQGQAGQKGVRIEVQGSPVLPLTSDRRLARLVLSNLVGRAVQLTQSGRVLVELAADGMHHDIRICDSAPTLRGRERDEIFEPLRSSADLGWRGGSGSGLGLHVVRDIARAMHGDLELEDARAGTGNAIRLSLPALPLALPETSASRRENLTEPPHPGANSSFSTSRQSA